VNAQVGKTTKKKLAKSASVSPQAATVPAVSRSGKLKFQSVLQRDEVSAYFEAIVAGLASGKLTLEQGENGIDLSPANDVEVTLKARKKGVRERLELEISWSTPSETPLSVTPLSVTRDVESTALKTAPSAPVRRSKARVVKKKAIPS
jgi:amphi-Trp domain-containing protein